MPARYLRALVHRLTETGVDVDPPLRAVGLSLEALSAPDATVGRLQLTAAMQRLAKATGRTDIGFEQGALVNIATIDVVGKMLLSASTLAEGLAGTSRYFALLTPSFRMTVEPAGEVYRLRGEPSQPLPYDVTIYGLEIMAVGMHRLLTFMTQQRSVPARLDASWSAPPHAARYRELKGLQVRFGVGERPGFVMTLAASLVEAPLPMADPLVARDVEASCRRMLAEITRGRSWTQWVTTMLRGVEGHFPSQRELAAMVWVSNRTLARAR